MLTLLIACRGGDKDSAADDYPFLLAQRNLGSPYASKQDMDLSDGAAAYFAAEHAVPGLLWDDPPGSKMPLYLWEEVLTGANVADEGSCPYTALDGSTVVTKTGCRSQEGYDWEGEVRELEFEEDGLRWSTWDFDLEVSSEEEDRHFDRIRLLGQIWFALGDGENLERHAQVNMKVEAEGFWAGTFDDELEAAWHELAITGTWESFPDQRQVFDADFHLGDYGGFSSSGDQVDDACGGEPKGRIELNGAQAVVLSFEGQDSCEGCARMSVDGESTTNACRGWD